MNTFEYARIGDALVSSLADSLVDGRSVAVLGARNVGKRYLLRQLATVLRNRGITTDVVGFSDLSEENPALRHTSHGDLRGVANLPPDSTVVAERWRAGSYPNAVLLAANVDGLPTADEEELLSCLDAVGWAGVLVTCEARGAGWFTGPEPVRRCDRLVVVSGFDEAEFRKFASQYVHRLCSASPDQLVAQLYEHTNGSVYLLRVWMWGEFDRWATEVEQGSSDEFTLTISGTTPVAVKVPWNHYLRYITRLVSQRSEIWPQLEQLVATGSLPADPHGPTVLEMSGLVFRGGDELRLPEYLLGAFLRRHYTPRKLAELYAGRGDWDGAFRRLEALGQRAQAGLSHIDELADFSHLVRRLGADLFRHVKQGRDSVWKLFEQGCSLLLGFPEVVMWELDRPGAEWKHRRGVDLPLPDEYRPVIEAINKVDQELSTQTLPGQPEFVGLLFSSPVVNPHRKAVVMVRDANAGRVLAADRFELLRELCEAFFEAFTAATETERLHRSNRIQKRLDEAISAIFSELGAQVPSVGAAVRRALAALLARSGGDYSRVLVSLIEGKGEGRLLRGYLGLPEESTHPLCESINYPLNSLHPSLHLAALRGESSVSDADPQHNPEADTAVAEAANLHACAVVPLTSGQLDPETGRRVAIGTLFVERRDGLRPSPDELDQLSRYGRNLAGVIEQAERIQLLQSGLAQQREPFLLFDKELRLRYVNDLGLHQLNLGAEVEAGWQLPAYELPRQTPSAQDFLGEAVTVAGSALMNGVPDRRLVAASRAAGYPIHYWSLFSKQIVDREPKRTLGVLLEGQDLTYPHQIFAALAGLVHPDTLAPESGGTSDDLLGRLIESLGGMLATRLGFPVAEFHRFCRESNTFRPELRFRGDGQSENTATAAYQASGSALVCFIPPGPRAFHYDSRRDYFDGTTGVLDTGLRDVINVHHPWFDTAILPESRFWIDLPVVVGTQKVGKFVLPWAEDRSPDQFELLRSYLAMAQQTATAVLELAGRMKEVNDRISRQSLEKLLHTVGSPLKHMDTDVDILSLPRTDSVTRMKVSRRLKRSLKRAGHYVQIISNLRAVDEFSFEMFDLRELVNEVLSELCEDIPVVPQMPAERVEISGDRAHLKLCLAELVENSRKYCSEDNFQLQITVEVQTASDFPAVILTHSDNGPGIPHVMRDRLFERGAAAPPAGTDKQGSGLGLFYVAQVLKSHHGRIEAVTPPKGARFLITLPLNLSGLAVGSV